MKKVVVGLLIALALLTWNNGWSQVDIGFKGVGMRIGYIMPEDPIENTLGFGAQVELGTIMPNLGVSAIVDYWKKSYDTGGYISSDFSEIVIGALAKYYFEINSQIKPYAGGGLGFAIGSSSWEYVDPFTQQKNSDSESDTDIGVFFQGGAEYPISPNFNGFAELKYHIGGADYFGIMIGFNYMFGK